MTELHKLLESVKDESTFLAFVEALRADREAEDAAGQVDRFGRGKQGWENHTIEAFRRLRWPGLAIQASG